LAESETRVSLRPPSQAPANGRLLTDRPILDGAPTLGVVSEPADDVRRRPPAAAPLQDPWGNLPLLAALVLAGLEAVLLVGAAVWSLVAMVRAGFAAAAVSVALAVVLLLIAVLLLTGINALWHGRRWGRGPVLTWQLIQSAALIGSLGQAPPIVVIAVLVASAVVIVGLLLPSSIAATSRASSGTVI
jgi:hypothetical protein